MMQFMRAATSFDPVKDLPHPLLDTDEHSDFTRNFREMQKRSKRPYSLTKVLKSYCKTPPKLDGFEQEVHEELQSLNRARSPVGRLVPVEALSTLRRDLSIAGYPQIVQTSVGDQIIPFLRAKTICGRLGATIIDGLTGGNVRLPRAIVGGMASWLPETGGGTDADQSLDSFVISPKRISGSTVMSRQLVYQSSPDIEDFVANDIATAIGVAVDNAAINGSGTAPQPLGILHYPVNASGSYTYASRSTNVTFGGEARIRVAGVAAGGAEWLLMQEIAQHAEREASHHSPLPRWRGCGENRSESSEDRSEPLPYSYLGQFFLSC
jgi:hypothetical protein